MITHSKSVGVRLLRWVFGCHFVVAVIVTSTQLASEYYLAWENTVLELSNASETIEGFLVNYLRRATIWTG
jgi:hypothetical protein